MGITSVYKKTTYGKNGVEISSTTSREIDPVKTMGTFVVGMLILFAIIIAIPALILYPLYRFISYPLKTIKDANDEYENPLLSNAGFPNLGKFRKKLKIKTYLTYTFLISCILFIAGLTFSSGEKDVFDLFPIQLTNSILLIFVYMFLIPLFSKERVIVKKLEEKEISFLEKLSFFDFVSFFIVALLLKTFGVPYLFMPMYVDGGWNFARLFLEPFYDSQYMFGYGSTFSQLQDSYASLYILVNFNYIDLFFLLLIIPVLAISKGQYLTKNKEKFNFALFGKIFPIAVIISFAVLSLVAIISIGFSDYKNNFRYGDGLDTWISIGYPSLIFGLMLALILYTKYNKKSPKKEENVKEIENIAKNEIKENVDTKSIPKLKLYLSSYLISVVLAVVIFIIIGVSIADVEGYFHDIITYPLKTLIIHVIFALILSIIVFPVRFYIKKRKLNKIQS